MTTAAHHDNKYPSSISTRMHPPKLVCLDLGQVRLLPKSFTCLACPIIAQSFCTTHNQRQGTKPKRIRHTPFATR